MIPLLRSFDDVDGKERGQNKTDDLRAMTALGPRTLGCVSIFVYFYVNYFFPSLCFLSEFSYIQCYDRHMH